MNKFTDENVQIGVIIVPVCGSYFDFYIEHVIYAN